MINNSITCIFHCSFSLTSYSDKKRDSNDWWKNKGYKGKTLRYLNLYPLKSNGGHWFCIILLLQGFTEWLRITQTCGSAQRIGVLIRPWHWQWALLGALQRGSCRNVVLNNSRQTVVCKWSRKQMVLNMQKKTHQNTEKPSRYNHPKRWCIMIRDGNHEEYNGFGSVTVLVHYRLHWSFF